MRTITPESRATKAAARANRLYDTLEKEGFSAQEIGLVGAAILAEALRDLPTNERAPATLAHLSALVRTWADR